MLGTKHTILFFLAFFLTIFLVTIIGIIFSPFINNISDYIYYNIVSPILFTFYFFTFIAFQGIIRKIYTNKYINENQILIKSKAKKFQINEKLLIYLVIILIYFSSMIRNFSIQSITLPKVLLFILSIIIIEIALKFSSKSLYGYFTKDYIIISGIDLRISLPIIYGSNILNDSNVYTYNDIKEYFTFPETIELYLIGEQGKLVFNTDNELSRQFLGILKQKKIPMKKFN
ncbi:hypothetical protein GOQ29_04145 [Clostridium sp. D2Q-14]|uniref:hypothetical protein n=1 Tax=Anaeromonas gelatinilytica TaxID=2683194 RepID=UPI00193B98DF|nr:hypothetical protein [Anaeromonas gelatinilytica]MBS4534804.1 hypothetical protein [Anaeromonas gelatinilytica]